MPLFHIYSSRDDHSVGTPWVYVPRYLIPESGTVRVHVLVAAGSVVDKVAGNVWTVVGSLPFNGASGSYPESAGPFSTANYLSASGDYINQGTAYTWAAILKLGSNVAQNIFSDMVDTVGGQLWQYDNTTVSQEVSFNTTDGLFQGVQANPSPVASGSVAVAFGGWDGTTYYFAWNAGPLATSGPKGGPGTGGARTLFIGKQSTGAPWLGTISELYYSSVTPTSASLAALYKAISGSLGGLVP